LDSARGARQRAAKQHRATRECEGDQVLIFISFSSNGTSNSKQPLNSESVVHVGSRHMLCCCMQVN
jgi:hypothetical protein